MDYRLEQLRFELREDPSSRIFFKLGEHLRRAGELDEAVEVLRKGLEQHPRYVAAWVSLGRAQLAAGDADGAQASLERALQLDPENAVAARAMGEAAIVNAAWVTAVKALKRARGLTPQDETLDERITFVEARLAELGLLETPMPTNRQQPPTVVEDDAEGTAVDEPFTMRLGGDTGQWNEADDVFPAGSVETPLPEEPRTAGDDDGSAPASEYAIEEPSEFPPPPPLTEDDVASMVDAGDGPAQAEPAVTVHEEELPPPDEAPAEETAVEDVSEAPEPEPFLELEPETETAAAQPFIVVPEPEPEPVFDAAPEVEPEPVPEPQFEVEPEPEPTFDAAPEVDVPVEPVVTSAPEPEPLPEAWPDPDAEPDVDLERGADGLPLPTMTLARLAIDQGDLDLAERTLRGVLERQPGHAEAAELLETVIAGPPAEGASAPPPKSTDDAKAETLRRWLDAVRLASERLKT